MASSFIEIGGGTGGGGGAVSSVNGESGAVLLDAGDIPFTPAGSLVSTNVQDAVQEVADQSSRRGIGISIKNGAADISTGFKGYITVPYSGIIKDWTLLAEETGSIVIDVWKDTYANFPPTIADTITGTEKPTISASNKGQDLTLSSWTTTVNEGDIFAFNVDSCSNIKNVTLFIHIEET